MKQFLTSDSDLLFTMTFIYNDLISIEFAAVNSNPLRSYNAVCLTSKTAHYDLANCCNLLRWSIRH